MTNRDTIFYRYSLDDARHIGDVPKWRESHVANLECKQAIEDAIKEGYKDNKLDKDCAKKIIDKFGFDRTNFILRCTLRLSREDGRYSSDNLKWADGSRVSSSNFRGQYAINAHPTIINGFVDQARREWDALNLFDSHHLDRSGDANNYEGKVLILLPDTLKDQYKTPSDQLFLATSGFGCSPTAIGRSVSGYFLSDGEFASFTRSDFYGVIDNQFLPDWAEEKAHELMEGTNDDISMT